MKSRLVICFLFLLFPAGLCAQAGAEGLPAFGIEEWIERIFPNQEEDFDYNDIYDRLFSMYPGSCRA